MISVITPTYNTAPDVLRRTYNSLLWQTYVNWQWVVFDDSTTSQAYEWLQALDDPRVEVFRSKRKARGIGEVKRWAFMLGTGRYLVELDHDDELMPTALERINESGAGFVYSNWSEINSEGMSCRYPDGWAFGYGSDYWDGQRWVCRSPPINRRTVSHIVSVPNHVRAWRSDVYRQLGGHDPQLIVCDDYDLILRTILATDVEHLDEVLYLQHIGNTAQRQYNGLIQDMVQIIHDKYKGRLDAML